METNLKKHLDFTNAGSSITARSSIIVVVALFMLIPLGFVAETVRERGHRYNAVLMDIANTWGQRQTLIAAIVIVPYTVTKQSKETITNANGFKQSVNREKNVLRQAYFLPDDLTIDASLQDEQRQRGIFKSLVYNADVSLVATFTNFSIKSSETIQQIHWEDAWISVGLSDTRAINRVDTFKWDGVEKKLTPGTRYQNLATGFHAKLEGKDASFTPGTTRTLNLNMNIKGSESFLFTPLGETTRVNINSPWPHPSFTGNALPNERNVSDSGFTATWDIPHLARNYQQHWTSDKDDTNLFEFTSGVSMFEPVSLYSQVTRAVKYGLLFIGLTFLTLFIFELAIARKLHVVQYGLIGVALSLFFLVLLSLSEHIDFMLAYACAAALTISMISTYVWMALGSFNRATMICLLLGLLYAVLYSLLQFEDFALLVGTGLLVLVLMILMFVTRKIQFKEDAPQIANAT